MTRHTQRRAATVVALSLSALAAVDPMATAAEGAGPNHQVAVVKDSGTQLEFSSDVNGTAQVMSSDGNLVVFSTAAPLVPSDDNEVDDVYLRDRRSGVTLLVSHRRGNPGNDSSFEPTISSDGSVIAFTTWATNLVGKDRNGSILDVVAKNMETGRLQRVSQTTAGFQRRQNSFFPVISGNGRHVAFQTFGSFDVRDDDNREDVYVRSLTAGTTREVSLHPDGRDIRASVLVGDISDNGRRIVFGHDNAIWARLLGKSRTTLRVWQEPDQPPCQPDPMGSLGRPTISGNGKFVAVSSCATDFRGENGAATDIYRFDLATGDIVRMPEKGDGNSYSPSLSRSGRYVGFGSEATDLVAGDDEGMPDAFVADFGSGTVVRASEGPDGAGGNSWNATTGVAISADGRSLAYSSYSGNLVEGDAFDEREVFVWQR